MEPSLDFSHSEQDRAVSYHRPLYLATLGDAVLGTAVLVVLRWTWPGRELWHTVEEAGWAGAAAAWAAIVVLASWLVRAPLSCWRGWWRERRWGFSTQSFGAWLADQGKGLAISVVLLAGAWTGVVALAHALPGWWPAPAAAGAALAVLFLSFVAPLLLEPVFNRFTPLADEALAAELLALGERAAVPVREVLVADASRRTTKVNAYVSGIGRTRRVVVYDTLLEAADTGALKTVVAHELGHRRERDVAKLTIAGMAGAVAAVLLVWGVLGTRVASGRELPVALLLLSAFQLVTMPLGAAWSRKLEYRADRWSLDLTGDLAAFERACEELGRRNLSDPAPPRLAYLFLFGHPTVPERVAAARARAA